jgi:hypothetical protein
MMARAIFKMPGKPPELVDVEPELYALQNQIGGYIESVVVDVIEGVEAVGNPLGDVVIYVDEDGRSKCLSPNIAMGDIVVGPVLVIGDGGHELEIDLTDEQVAFWMAKLVELAIPPGDFAVPN